ncbi:MAG: nucleoside 2-deoxyribosyltransferase [Proteobacteria bacterium]|nr:nucleoside 2-deoxyribosyltransferase [Pseudomonadota bacterium]
MKIYLAGPDVFLPDAIEIGRRKIELCHRYGLTGLYPLDSQIDRTAPDVSLQIFRANQAMMDSADAIVANLTPFRGPGADPGTVYELGYMAGRAKPCFGYTNDASLYADRVAAFIDVRRQGSDLIDGDGLVVENFDLADNLMMVHALDLRSPLVTPPSQPDDVWHDLATFETCVRLVSEQLPGRRTAVG